MGRYDWSDRYSVQVAELDKQHQGLMTIIAKLHAAMLARESKAVLGGILADLVSYTDDHFAYEESLMARFDYPALDDHQKNHRQLRATVLGLQDDHAQGKIVISAKVMEFLLSWLTKHIMGCDFLYKDFFQSEGLN